MHEFFKPELLQTNPFHILCPSTLVSDLGYKDLSVFISFFPSIFDSSVKDGLRE